MLHLPVLKSLAYSKFSINAFKSLKLCGPEQLPSPLWVPVFSLVKWSFNSFVVLLGLCCVPGTVLGSGDISQNKMDEMQALMGLTFSYVKVRGTSK